MRAPATTCVELYDSENHEISAAALVRPAKLGGNTAPAEYAFGLSGGTERCRGNDSQYEAQLCFFGGSSRQTLKKQTFILFLALADPAEGPAYPSNWVSAMSTLFKNATT